VYVTISAQLANATMMSTPAVHCRWEDDMVRERTDHPHPLADPEQKRGAKF